MDLSIKFQSYRSHETPGEKIAIVFHIWRVVLNDQGIVETTIIVGHQNLYTKALTAKLQALGIHSILITKLSTAIDVASSRHTKAIIIDLEGVAARHLNHLPDLLAMQMHTPIIVLASKETAQLAREAMQLGASVQLNRKSPQITSEIMAKLESFTQTKSELASDYPSDLGIIGSSFQMKEIFRQIELICHTDVNILILGESGTGKEMVARAIHQRSNRHKHQFEAINCAAIPDSLLESELFGYKRGAFTDARHDRQGLFERSNDGTLFLDEIGEISPLTQVKLLRVLQEREVRPLGCNHTIKVNTRVIAATNKNLEDQIKKGEFREDLYFRLAVIPIELPPLRERKEDIPSLISHFLDYFNKRYKLSVHLPSKRSYDSLLAYHWPGNIRELQNVIERGVIMARNHELNLDHFTKASKDKVSFEDVNSLHFATAKKEFERTYILRLLEATKGNIAEAARISGKFRTDIYRMMERYNLESVMFKKAISHERPGHELRGNPNI